MNEVSKGDDKFLVATRVELVLFPMEPNCAKLSSVWRRHVMVDRAIVRGSAPAFGIVKVAYVSERGDI